jgi:hypothetical protein
MSTTRPTGGSLRALHGPSAVARAALLPEFTCPSNLRRLSLLRMPTTSSSPLEELPSTLTRALGRRLLAMLLRCPYLAGARLQDLSRTKPVPESSAPRTCAFWHSSRTGQAHPNSPSRRLAVELAQYAPCRRTGRGREERNRQGEVPHGGRRGLQGGRVRREEEEPRVACGVCAPHGCFIMSSEICHPPPPPPPPPPAPPPPPPAAPADGACEDGFSPPEGCCNAILNPGYPVPPGGGTAPRPAV